MFKKRRLARQLEQVNLLELIPVRLEPWGEVGGRVVVERRKPAGSARLGKRLAFWLAVRRIRLDAHGSHAWKLLDGKTSVAEVSESLRREFGDEVEPAEERTGELVRLLHDQRLLAYPGWDELPSREPVRDDSRFQAMLDEATSEAE